MVTCRGLGSAVEPTGLVSISHRKVPHRGGSCSEDVEPAVPLLTHGDPNDRAESARVLRDMTSCRCPGGSSPRPRPAHGRRRSDHRSRSGRQLTRVLAEQTTSIDPQRLGANAGFLSGSELRRVDAALRLVLDL